MTNICKVDMAMLTNQQNCLHIKHLSFDLKNTYPVYKFEKHRVALSCLRCSAHKLMIEEGRYGNID